MAHAEQDFPLETVVDVASLLQAATHLEDEKYANGGDDADGFELASRPPSPLTDLDESSQSSEDEQGQGTSRGAEKDRRKKAAKNRRRLKRIAKARSGHAATTYSVKPSVLAGLDYLSAIEVNMDAQELPSSSEGSWTGKRTKGEKATPWTLQELEKHGFKVIEWDGRSVASVFYPMRSIPYFQIGKHERFLTKIK